MDVLKFNSETQKNETIYSGPLVDVRTLFPEENEALIVQYTMSEKKQGVRSKIQTEAGDLASLVGTVSDGSGLLLEQVARGFVGLAAASSLADVRAAVADAAALLQPLLDQIDAGAVVLPHHVKGAETVLGDVAARSTTVSNVLIAAAGE